MIEAVGEEFWPKYFSQLRDRLLPGGLAGIQAITIQDKLFPSYRREVDFIKRYIFPGSNIPSVPVLQDAARELALEQVEDITPHYAETLKRWRENFLARWERIGALGFSEEFRRLWKFYFCYCEGGFRERLLGDVQMVFVRGAAPA